MRQLLLLILFQSYIFSAGFAGKTLLLTDHDQISFDQLNQKMLIQASKNDVQPIIFFHKRYVEQVVQLSFADEIIICHPKQLFWCVNKNSWICAQDLISGDLLKTVDEQYIAIDAVQLVQQKTEIYSLTVGPPHYLYVGKHAVLAHNVVPFVLVATAPLTSTIAVKVATTVLGTGLVAFGAWVTNLFAKNRNNKKPKLSVAEKSVGRGPVFFNPNDDDKNDFFTKLKSRSTKYVRTKRFGKMYKDPETGLWWSKDLEQHGGSCFKVFKETAKSFEWIFDADHMGNTIVGKNKGPIGMSIPFKEVIFRT
jgi:hypothetical protein